MHQTLPLALGFRRGSTLSSSTLRLRRTLPPSPQIRTCAKSKMNSSSPIRMRTVRPNVPTPAVLRRISTSTIGTSPAWKRHCILQRSKSTATKKKNATIPPEETNVSYIADQIKSFSIGSFAGLLGSLAGMGGGFVMIPMMTAARQAISTSASSKGVSVSLSSFLRGGLGLHQHQAHGTSLFAVGTTGLAGALGYGITFSGEDESSLESDRHDINNASDPIQQQKSPTDANDRPQGLVELDVALALAATAMVTARFGAIASSRLSERALQRALGAFMIFVAPLIPGKAYLESLRDGNNPSDPDVQKHIKEDDTKHPEHGHMSQIERLLPVSLIGVFSGFLSGMFGVGGGAIVVPSLVLSTDMNHHAALGTSLCAMVLPAMVGTWTHSKRGNVNWRVAPMLAFGSAVGAFVGGREVGMNLDEGVLRAGFSCLMLVLGVRTWRKAAR